MSLKPRAVDFAATWSSLRETVEGVVSLGAVKRASWNERFSDVYSLCVAHPVPLADELYDETKKFLEEHVRRRLAEVEHDGENENEALLLERYRAAWTRYSSGVAYLDCLYSYLNQQHIKRHKISEADLIYGNADRAQDKMEIGELGLVSWENALSDSLRERIERCVLEAAREAHTDEEYAALRTVVRSFVDMQRHRKKNPLELYCKLVEAPLLEATSERCRREAADLLQRCDASEYMKETLRGMEREMERARRFLHESSLHKLRRVIEKRTVEDNLAFLHDECEAMVEQERHEDLRNAYALLKPIRESLGRLADAVYERVKRRGLAETADLGGDKVHVRFVEKMLAVHDEYAALVERVFDGDKAFADALDKACAAVANAPGPDGQPCRSPQHLARYCDALLKKSTRGGEADAEERLAASIVVFKYIEDKDVFQKIYSQLMANRLVHQQSYSVEQEELMIKRLKETCGYEFTNKLLRMFTDVSISADNNLKFQKYLKERDVTLGIGFGAHVLQSGAWPWSGANAPAPALPAQLETPVRLFEAFYATLYNGRKLTWLQHQCVGELRVAHLPRKTYLVTMQTALMTVLLEFETLDSIAVADLSAATALAHDHLVRHLQSLVDFRLLLSDANPITPDAVVRLNPDFSNKRTKLRIPLSPGGGGAGREPADVERIAASVEEDRKLFLQAAVVRIMKARKLLKHQELVQEVLCQAKVSFAPNIAMIKKCIEILIEKQYIERTQNSEEYRYLA